MHYEIRQKENNHDNNSKKYYTHIILNVGKLVFHNKKKASTRDGEQQPPKKFVPILQYELLWPSMWPQHRICISPKMIYLDNRDK